MLHQPFPTWSLALIACFLIASCTSSPAPIAATPTATVSPPSPTPLPTQPPTNTPTTLPSPTNTSQPTLTPTAAPPTLTPTRTPLPVTNTPRPTQPPAATRTPAVVPPTAPPSAPGVDVLAVRGKETCINKFVNVSYTWEEGPDDRKMYYWDERWSVYPDYARPNIKLQTAKAMCNAQKQCRGLTADFCVWIDPSAPIGGPYESVLHLIIFSQLGNRSGTHILAEVDTMFSWLIK